MVIPALKSSYHSFITINDTHMNIIIIEDELNAYSYLKSIILSQKPETRILTHIESVEDAVNELPNYADIDLIFMDIQLADGLSFEIFNHISVKAPIIFTTAFDQYAIEAFKVNSIDYLLKPVDPEELKKALQKFDSYDKRYAQTNHYNELQNILLSMDKRKKQRFLVKKGGHYEFIDIKNVGTVASSDGITFVFSKGGQRYIYNKTIEQLSKELDTDQFFQINRAQIINIDIISKAHPYFNNRMKLELSMNSPEEYVVSRSKLSVFKAWLDR